VAVFGRRASRQYLTIPAPLPTVEGASPRWGQILTQKYFVEQGKPG
jgi:hypothetical protein